MIADLKPYAEYKDSGLSWLGRVPAHWQMRPAFGAFMPIRARNYGMREKTVLSLSYGRIIIKPPEKLHGLVPESFETYQIVNPGDIVLRTTDLQNDHSSRRVGMVRDRGIITSAYLALQVNAGVSPNFGFQFLNVWDMSKAIYGYGSGLRQNLDFSHFKRMPVAVPPPAEQAAIVRFLDWANRRLELAIRAKRKVIALLNEQKQAIIHRAVTRGLDPSVPLKPSGTPWLGDIPQHWEVRPLGRFITLQRGFDITKSQQEPGPIPVISSGGASSFHNKSTSPGPGVVLGRKGSVGAVHFIDGPYWAHDTTLWVRDFGGNHPRLVYYLLSLLHLERFDTGSSNPTLNRNLVHPEVACLPPIHEQASVAAFLDDVVGKTEWSTLRLEREIELLREYRTRLAADVVTGKLDVRGAAARLPGEVLRVVARDYAELNDEIDLVDEEAIA